MNAEKRISYQVKLRTPTDCRVGYPIVQVFPGSLPLKCFMKMGGVTLEDILEGCVLNKIPEDVGVEIEIYHTTVEASRLVWKSLLQGEADPDLAETGGEIPTDVEEEGGD